MGCDMTDLKKLRMLAEIAARHNGYGVFTTDECQNFSDAANPQAIIEILDRLERLENCIKKEIHRCGYWKEGREALEGVK